VRIGSKVIFWTGLKNGFTIGLFYALAQALFFYHYKIELKISKLDKDENKDLNGCNPEHV
jgi:hypothetical protein